MSVWRELNMKKKARSRRNNMAKRLFIIAIAMSLILILLLIRKYALVSEFDEVKYSEIITCIENCEVKEISSYYDSNDVEVTFKDGTKKSAYVPSISEFWRYVNEQREFGNDIDISVKMKSSTETSINILNLLTMICLMFFVIKNLTGVGDFKLKNVTTDVKFTDVAGIEEEQEQLLEVVNFLKKPKRYTRMGARIPKGILLEGAPGTGKTLLAKAIAGEAGVPFFQVTASSFDEKFVGVGSSRVRKIFSKAKKVAPSIIFIDEIDSVAKKRYSNESYSSQTLNQLLAEMDGFDSNSHVIVIGATNHKEVLDPAILRSGRFDRHVHISMPNTKARKEILEVHARNKKFSSDVSFKELAKKTVEFSGANLENMLNEAALLAVNLNFPCITNEILDEAIATVIVGIKKESSTLSEEEIELTAIHEAGHAVVSAYLRPNVKNFCISIIQRGKAGGYNFFDEGYKTYKQKSDMKNQIIVMYGGRCAEEVLIKDISTGALNDLEKAADLAYRMVMNYAMTDDSKLVKIHNRSEFNKKIEDRSIQKIEEICDESYSKALEIVTKNREVISKLAALLVEKEYLSDSEVSAFMTENLFRH